MPVSLSATSAPSTVQNQHTRELIIHNEDVPLVEFVYLVFTRMPDESDRWRLRSLLLYLCYVFRALIISPVCRFCTSALGFVLFQICSIYRTFYLTTFAAKGCHATNWGQECYIYCYTCRQCMFEDRSAFKNRFYNNKGS